MDEGLVDIEEGVTGGAGFIVLLSILERKTLVTLEAEMLDAGNQDSLVSK